MSFKVQDTGLKLRVEIPNRVRDPESLSARYLLAISQLYLTLGQFYLELRELLSKPPGCINSACGSVK